ncbi:hypothetical protein RND71_026381 [Anisodus tanguticus]|uniref:Uncharacterized protein n=1 Tax=Anisodus tanguticus TaxID=243964 RepID=A0AAE1V3R3_9SOLA|nr:hypothetical protein RND71_026381 [Anisodus tanguticus]
MSNTPAVGIQDHVASLNPSIHQCEASNKAKGCRISVVVKTQLGQTIISPAMQPESRLLKEVKTEIEDVALDIIQGCTGETVVQGTDLKVICKVVQELQKKRLTEVDRNFLVVKDAEKMKGHGNIENEKKDLESMKAELRKLKSETQRKEDLLYLDTLLTEDMGSLINDQALKIQPLMEAFSHRIRLIFSSFPNSKDGALGSYVARTLQKYRQMRVGHSKSNGFFENPTRVWQRK